MPDSSYLAGMSSGATGVDWWEGAVIQTAPSLTSRSLVPSGQTANDVGRALLCTTTRTVVFVLKCVATGTTQPGGGRQLTTGKTVDYWKDS